jgi:undecaprenyl-diphosphatase
LKEKRRVNDLLRTIILGIIEGLTEFLPVSSTGHLILAMPCLSIDAEQAPWPAFLYFIQIGAIAAVVICFRRRLWRQVVSKPANGWSNHLLVKLVIATIPAAVVGLPLNAWVEAHLEKPLPVAVALIIGAGVMVLIERRYRRPTGPTVEQITVRQALFIGLAQCVSIIPGTSRAMATIMGGMLVGLPAATAVEFSFYLAIPTLCGAGVVRLLKDWADLSAAGGAVLAVGFGVSLVVAWLVVAGFHRYVQTRSMYPFAVYRVVLGVIVAIWWFAR